MAVTVLTARDMLLKPVEIAFTEFLWAVRADTFASYIEVQVCLCRLPEHLTHLRLIEVVLEWVLFARSIPEAATGTFRFLQLFIHWQKNTWILVFKLDVWLLLGLGVSLLERHGGSHVIWCSQVRHRWSSEFLLDYGSLVNMINCTFHWLIISISLSLIEIHSVHPLNFIFG